MPEERNDKVRPKPETTTNKESLLKLVTKDNKSLRQSLALIGITTVLLGILIWIFLRGLERPALIITVIGGFILVVDGLISLATVRKAIFGRRGRYGLNTAIVFILVLVIAILLNITLYVSSNKPNPAGWLRIDTTATKQFLLEEQVVNTLENDGVEQAKNKCNSSVGPVANLCFNALEKAENGADAAEKTLDQTGSIEMASLEKNMTWISLCIATAPMLGFLGTVWGMIQAFNDIKMANDISPAVVAGGISVALLTTAFGLVVAVVLQILQNAVMYIIDNQIVTMQKSTTMLLNAIGKGNLKK